MFLIVIIINQIILQIMSAARDFFLDRSWFIVIFHSFFIILQKSQSFLKWKKDFLIIFDKKVRIWGKFTSPIVKWSHSYTNNGRAFKQQNMIFYFQLCDLFFISIISPHYSIFGGSTNEKKR